MKSLFTIAILLFAQSVSCQNLYFFEVQAVPAASFRGLSVVDDKTVWVSGSKGWIGQSTNRGKSWTFKQLKGYEKYDFRSLYAFDAKTAVIANAGTPAFILRTTDGGITWKEVYKNEDTSAFFDGIDFWNSKEGIIYGDPLKGRLMILHTNDGGQTWKEIPEANRPALADGEASFAASGTNIRCFGKNKVIIATGGKVSRLWVSEDKGIHWRSMKTPILQGTNSTGIFSFAFSNNKNGIIVGGDYKHDSVKTAHVFHTRDGGKTWLQPKTPTGGYRECVEYISPKTLIATGPGGTDISYDGGINWKPICDEKGFHVIRKARNGSKELKIIAGSNKLYTLQFLIL